MANQAPPEGKPIPSEWETLPTVSELRDNMTKRALNDWAKILQAAGLERGKEIEGIQMGGLWGMTRDQKLKGRFVVNRIEIRVNAWESDPDEWRYEARWEEGGWTCSDYLYNLNPQWFVEVLGDPSPEVMRFLNVTDACLKHLNSYWNDSKGRSIEQFIEDCLEEHGDGFGPTSWRSKPAVA